MKDYKQPLDDNYWKIEAWKTAVSLAVDIEKIFSNFTEHYISRDLQGLALDLSSHISLGFEEQNHLRSVYWLRKAKQLCTTIRTRLYLSGEMMVVNENTIERLIEKVRKVSTLLSKSMEIANDIKLNSNTTKS